MAFVFGQHSMESIEKDENVGEICSKRWKKAAPHDRCNSLQISLCFCFWEVSLWESGQSGGFFWAHWGSWLRVGGSSVKVDLPHTPFLTRRLITLQSPDHTHQDIIVQESQCFCFSPGFRQFEVVEVLSSTEQQGFFFIKNKHSWRLLCSSRQD